jgi:hypothetical protein
LRDAGYDIEDDVVDPSTAVVSIPVNIDQRIKTVKDVSAK